MLNISSFENSTNVTDAEETRLFKFKLIYNTRSKNITRGIRSTILETAADFYAEGLDDLKMPFTYAFTLLLIVYFDIPRARASPVWKQTILLCD